MYKNCIFTAIHIEIKNTIIVTPDNLVYSVY